MYSDRGLVRFLFTAYETTTTFVSIWYFFLSFIPIPILLIIGQNYTQSISELTTRYQFQLKSLSFINMAKAVSLFVFISAFQYPLLDGVLLNTSLLVKSDVFCDEIAKRTFSRLLILLSNLPSDSDY